MLLFNLSHFKEMLNKIEKRLDSLEKKSITRL